MGRFRVSLSFSWGLVVVDLNRNGFVLMEALLAFLIVTVCVVLLLVMVQLASSLSESRIDDEIQTQWFYAD